MLNKLFVSDRTLKLNIKISLIILIVLSSIFIILYWSTVFYTEKYILNRLDKELSYDLIEVKERLWVQSDQNSIRMKSIINDIELQELLVKKDTQNIKKSLDRIISIYPALNYIFLINKEKHVASISKVNNTSDERKSLETDRVKLEEISATAYLQNEMRQSTLLEDPFTQEKRKLIQLYFSPIKENNEIIGWIGASYKWQEQALNLLNHMIMRMLETDQFVTEIIISNGQGNILQSRSILFENSSDYQIGKTSSFSVADKEFKLKIVVDGIQATQFIDHTSKGIFSLILLGPVHTN